METLTAKFCRECGKPILVAECEPHPLQHEATGMSADRWDSDREQFYFVGWICNDCAWASAMSDDGGSIGGGVSYCYPAPKVK